MSNATVGRHRAAKRYNPLTELAVVVSRSGATSAKTTSVLAASGGLVAALAIPANATAATDAKSTAATPALTAAATAAPAVAVKAPAVSAAVTKAVVTPIAFTAVAKPKPKPRPVVVVEAPVAQVPQQTSRSTVRAALPKKASNPAPQLPTTGGVLAIAASLSGIPYVYGGTTPAGFDCSGFTSYVFRQVGISLPRTAAQQQAMATPVSNPQPGDLVFSGYPAYHVGIYAGNGMMYDSPRTGKSSGLRAVWDANATYGRVG